MTINNTESFSYKYEASVKVKYLYVKTIALYILFGLYKLKSGTKYMNLFHL